MWKLTKIEERIFGGDCRGACMHNQGCEKEEASTVF